MTEEKTNPKTCTEIALTLAHVAHVLHEAVSSGVALDLQKVAHGASALRDLAAAWKDCPHDLEYSE